MKRSIATSSSADANLKKAKLENEEEGEEEIIGKSDVVEETESGEEGTGFVNLDDNLLFLPDVEEAAESGVEGTGFINLDENLLFEILKHVDARSLAMAGCVSKLWHRTAQDERLWELICTRHWANIGCGTLQLRSVVLALGGFRRLHSLYLWPLSKPAQQRPQPRLATPYSMMPPAKSGARLGKDEVQLSLSLFSIRYFEKMNFTGRDK